MHGADDDDDVCSLRLPVLDCALSGERSPFYTRASGGVANTLIGLRATAPRERLAQRDAERTQHKHQKICAHASSTIRCAGDFHMYTCKKGARRTNNGTCTVSRCALACVFLCVRNITMEPAWCERMKAVYSLLCNYMSLRALTARTARTVLIALSIASTTASRASSLANGPANRNNNNRILSPLLRGAAQLPACDALAVCVGAL